MEFYLLPYNGGLNVTSLDRDSMTVLVYNAKLFNVLESDYIDLLPNFKADYNYFGRLTDKMIKIHVTDYNGEGVNFDESVNVVRTFKVPNSYRLQDSYRDYRFQYPDTHEDVIIGGLIQQRNQFPRIIRSQTPPLPPPPCISPLLSNTNPLPAPPIFEVKMTQNSQLPAEPQNSPAEPQQLHIPPPPLLPVTSPPPPPLPPQTPSPTSPVSSSSNSQQRRREWSQSSSTDALLNEIRKQPKLRHVTQSNERVRNYAPVPGSFANILHRRRLAMDFEDVEIMSSSSEDEFDFT